MDITLSIETTDQRIVRALMNGRNLTNRQPTPVAAGVEIVHVTGDAFGITKNQIWTFVVSGVTGITLNVVSSYLYDCLKDEPHPTTITINNKTDVHINLPSITTTIQQAISTADTPTKVSKAPSQHKTAKQKHGATKTPQRTMGKAKKSGRK